MSRASASSQMSRAGSSEMKDSIRAETPSSAARAIAGARTSSPSPAPGPRPTIAVPPRPVAGTRCTTSTRAAASPLTSDAAMPARPAPACSCEMHTMTENCAAVDAGAGCAV